MSLKGGDIVTWRGDDYDVLLKGGRHFTMCHYMQGRQLCVVSVREDNCHVLLHGGETTVMCCYSEGRQ